MSENTNPTPAESGEKPVAVGDLEEAALRDLIKDLAEDWTDDRASTEATLRTASREKADAFKDLAGAITGNREAHVDEIREGLKLLVSKEVIEKIADTLSTTPERLSEDVVALAAILAEVATLVRVNFSDLARHSDKVKVLLGDPKIAQQVAEIATLQRRQSRDEFYRNLSIAGRNAAAVPKWGFRLIKVSLMTVTLLIALSTVGFLVMAISDPAWALNLLSAALGRESAEKQMINIVEREWLPLIDEHVYGKFAPTSWEEAQALTQQFGDDGEAIFNHFLERSRSEVPATYTSRINGLVAVPEFTLAEMLEPGFDTSQLAYVTDEEAESFESRAMAIGNELLEALADHGTAIRQNRFAEEIELPIHRQHEKISQWNGILLQYLEIKTMQLRDSETQRQLNFVAAAERDFNSTSLLGLTQARIRSLVTTERLRQQLLEGSQVTDEVLRTVCADLATGFGDAAQDMQLSLGAVIGNPRAYNPWFKIIRDSADSDDKPAWQVLRRIWQHAVDNNYALLLGRFDRQALVATMESIFERYEDADAQDAAAAQRQRLGN